MDKTSAKVQYMAFKEMGYKEFPTTNDHKCCFIYDIRMR